MLQHCYNAKNGTFYGFVQIMLIPQVSLVCVLGSYFLYNCKLAWWIWKSSELEFTFIICIYIYIYVFCFIRDGVGLDLSWLAGNSVFFLFEYCEQKIIYKAPIFCKKKNMNEDEREKRLMESICLCMFYKIYLRMLNYLGCRGLFLPVVCLVDKSWKCTVILSYNTWKSFRPLTCFVIKASTINIGWWGIMVSKSLVCTPVVWYSMCRCSCEISLWFSNVKLKMHDSC